MIDGKADAMRPHARLLLARRKYVIRAASLQQFRDVAEFLEIDCFENWRKKRRKNLCEISGKSIELSISRAFREAGEELCWAKI